MKMKKLIVAGLAVLAAAAGVVTVAVAQDKDKGKEWGKDRERDELVTLAQTPEAVQQTIQKYASAADIKKIEQDEENGPMAYSVEIVKGDKESEIDVAADGTVTSADEGIALGDAPEAVQKALATQAGKAIEISKLTEKGVVQYEATLEQNGEEQEISITAEGQITVKNDAEDEDREGENGDQGGERDGHWGGHKGNGGEGDGHWGNREGDRGESDGQCGERKGRHGDHESDRGEGQGHGEGDKD